jgi:hypothetical protein
MALIYTAGLVRQRATNYPKEGGIKKTKTEADATTVTGSVGSDGKKKCN